MLFQCWATVYDAGPASTEYRLNASCLLGWYFSTDMSDNKIFLPLGLAPVAETGFSHTFAQFKIQDISLDGHI